MKTVGELWAARLARRAACERLARLTIYAAAVALAVALFYSATN